MPGGQGQGPHRQTLLGEEREGPDHGLDPGGVAVVDQDHFVGQAFEQAHLLPGQGGAEGGQDVGDAAAPARR